MSNPTIERYSQFAPVLKDPGWYETGAQGYGSVFFRKRIHSQQGLEITVGIVVCPTSWHYCGNISTPGHSEGIMTRMVRSKIEEAPWELVSAFFLEKGLKCYDVYLDRVDREI